MYLRVFLWISEQTAIISLYTFNLSVFITEAESVYYAVRTGYLNQTDTVSYLKGERAPIFDFSYKRILDQFNLYCYPV